MNKNKAYKAYEKLMNYCKNKSCDDKCIFCCDPDEYCVLDKGWYGKKLYHNDKGGGGQHE